MSGTTEKEYDMTSSEQKRFDALYLRHQRALKLQGYADKTIDVYSRASQVQLVIEGSLGSLQAVRRIQRKAHTHSPRSGCRANRLAPSGFKERK
jgi:hypothetical protein